ncbi:HAMP domain-containing histidine kinase [Ruminococcus sp. FMB-CY1]|uniref:sensor histidine kinase n=1 Tax=unclassified Ruminococcus TaxID=2608920 RepID=UPI00208E3628|nr:MULTISPECIES: HAMP domain-containing sensor histidine kinase [unclassified Ruminococcus]USP69748.1 HAMP domain-containing histidine kinase [Ruminococcus sp. FMBCY1]WBX56946.1 HAMP domain-containing histidine kinase [Ruminococcus sp. FMB-CY1]
MKNAQKFVCAGLAITIVFCVISAVFTFIGLENIRKTSNDTINQLVNILLEKYPDVSEKEVAEILNNKTEYTDNSEFLNKYGIHPEKDWVSYNNQGSYKYVILSVSVCIAFGLAFAVLFLGYLKIQKKQTMDIAKRIERINLGDYSLQIDRNSEDELSLLDNQIYRTAVKFREQAENSNKDKENLQKSLSDISHQLKTPLTSIIVMVDNILDDDDMPLEIRREFLNDIKHNTNTISFLVQSLLKLSKLDAEAVKFRYEQVEVKSIVDECIKNTAVMAEILGVRLETDCNDIILNCDRKWLCEAVTNIIKNCIEHSHNGNIKITADQNKLYTKISIKDNGSGITKEDLPHIFERFYKGKNSSDDSVGIGLSLAKTIIEKQGGYISVSSELNKGSEFVIKFFNN